MTSIMRRQLFVIGKFLCSTSMPQFFCTDNGKHGLTRKLTYGMCLLTVTR